MPDDLALALVEPPPPAGDAPPPPVPVVRVLDALSRLGFTLRTTGSHVVAVRGVERVVVAAHSPELPGVVVRRLDWSLAGTVGPGRLLAGVAAATDPSPGPLQPGAVTSESAAPRPSLELSAVLEQADPDGSWCSFLIEEPTIMGHGPTATAALADVGHAADAWLGAPRGTVVVREVRRARAA